MSQVLRGLTIVLASLYSVVAAAQPRPNILLILTDDQQNGTVEQSMPQVRSRIFDQGMKFTNAIVTTPICTPSRASILTGKYASRHGAVRNNSKLKGATLIDTLRASGYFTGLIGKYSNVHSGNKIKSFNYWVSFEGGASPYTNPRLNVQGKWRREKGYISYILRDHTVRYMNYARTNFPDRPFFGIVAFNAPHYKAKASPEHKGTAQGLQIPALPSIGEADMTDKPQWLQKKAKKRTPTPPGELQLQRARQFEALVSLDHAIAGILDYLDTNGLSQNTVVIFTSDNGFLFYEHYLRGKDVAYEEAIRVPMAIRYPPLFPAGSTESRIVANIDLRPTIETLAGLIPTPGVDGQSILALLNPASAWRNEIMVEGWPSGRPQYSALRTATHKLIRTSKENFLELYDLNNDPYEVGSQAQSPEAQPLLQDLLGRLVQLKGS